MGVKNQGATRFPATTGLDARAERTPALRRQGGGWRVERLRGPELLADRPRGFSVTLGMAVDRVLPKE
jgi:hypothetical protein